MDATKKRQNFLRFANQIKELGYDVYIVEYNDNTDYHNYGWIVNDKDEIGHFYLDCFGEGVSFSTEHKPCHPFGKGFCIDDEWGGWKIFTKETIDRVFIHHPEWAKNEPYHPLSEIRKWSAKEFIEKYWDKKHLKQL